MRLLMTHSVLGYEDALFYIYLVTAWKLSHTKFLGMGLTKNECDELNPFPLLYSNNGAPLPLNKLIIYTLFLLLPLTI